ncbi:MAG TPA: DNA-directed RNA polymerase subunit delta [Atopostipes sp.]|nr:DNA-directed RNA polymerase subunit delta [Atopostipes sp.]
MELKQFKGDRIDELAMIDVAKAVLEEKGEVMDFKDILLEVSNFIEINEDEMNKRMPQFYTDINVDGEFISLGDNTWGLRTWYPVDSINEVLTHENDEADIIPQISPDGFDDYDEVALEDEFKEELDEDDTDDTDTPEDETFVDIDGDGTVENLDDYQEDMDELDSEGLDDAELDDLAIVDDDDLLDEEMDDGDF